MPFSDNLDKYLESAQRKAVLEQLKGFLAEFVSSDTQRKPKTIRANLDNGLSVDVSEEAVARVMEELEEDIETTVAEMEAMP